MCRELTASVFHIICSLLIVTLIYLVTVFVGVVLYFVPHGLSASAERLLCLFADFGFLFLLTVFDGHLL